ncbi:hypothetical protein NFI96_001879 [Prochilodus magdalenae]|nr:hypothetical protein NFI96_001879 [Prochilodus magdalenae]
MEESKEDSTIQLSVGLEKRKAQPGLIEVISSTESAQPQQPKHHVIVYTKRGSLSRCVKLRVELPGDDILLEVEELYQLHLRFPERVNEETCCATYNKKKCVLTVTASVL